ncbi:MAG TPA: fasciclin domain-containing protein [Draconibacterium sp.]|nr:fasciclin domain-containing protein [Draconibacterium sp.]
MKIRIGILILGLIIIGAAGCTKQWDEHYNTYPETVDENVWDVIQSDPQFSSFVEIVKAAKMDTLFLSDISYTIFAPTNDAVATFRGVKDFDNVILAYHFCSHFINTSSIEGKRQIQTLTEKFALFERNGNEVKIDDIKVLSESPLYRNGKFFTMGQVIEPNPNLYEYYQFTNPVLSKYIDTQDTIILDKEKSKPLGFDEEGNTVYDTVSIVANKFEMKYFPVKHEFRSVSTTIVFPKEEDYREALNVMAQSLGGEYNDYNDIPLDWQEEILIPHILYQGVFLNRIEPEEFIWKSPKDTLKMLNVLGDSVVINYIPKDKALCSNGYAYNYESYTIPDSLYNGGTKFEGEALVNPTGLNKYSWNDSVSAKSDISLVPTQELIQGASNDSIIRVNFPKGYAGKFSLEFKSPKLFPRKYVMVISTHMDIGGIYDIYVNNELVKTFDYYAYIQGRGVIFSVTGDRYIPRGRFNKFDMYVNNIEEYGSAKIRLEYKAPGFVASNGLVIDFIEFIPVTE